MEKEKNNDIYLCSKRFNGKSYTENLLKGLEEGLRSATVNNDQPLDEFVEERRKNGGGDQANM